MNIMMIVSSSKSFKYLLQVKFWGVMRRYMRFRERVSNARILCCIFGMVMCKVLFYFQWHHLMRYIIFRKINLVIYLNIVAVLFYDSLLVSTFFEVIILLYNFLIPCHFFDCDKSWNISRNKLYNVD